MIDLHELRMLSFYSSVIFFEGSKGSAASMKVALLTFTAGKKFGASYRSPLGFVIEMDLIWGLWYLALFITSSVEVYLLEFYASTNDYTLF